MRNATIVIRVMRRHDLTNNNKKKDNHKYKYKDIYRGVIWDFDN